jgi:hypothetical protein
MNLTFKDSISGSHKIVTDSNGKKYLMDTSTIRPNVYGFGFLPKRVRVEMVEIDKKSRLFDKKTKVNGAAVAVGGALASTPILSKSIMELVRGSLDSHHIHEQPFLKYGIFLGIFILAFLIAQVMIGVSRFRVSKKLPSNPKKYIATFRTEGKSDSSFYIPLAINAVLLFFYARATSGGELLLMFNMMFSFWLFFAWLVEVPVDNMYNNKIFQIESIEEVK